MNNFRLASILLDQIRTGDNIAADQLISRANLFAYINRDQIDRIEQDGLKTPEKLMESHPEQAKKIFGDIVNHPIYKKCVFSFFCRVPTNCDNVKEFTENNVPVKIITSRLKRSNNHFKFLSFNFPGIQEPRKITEDTIEKLSQKESIMYKHFCNSNHPYLLDVPMVAIYCEDGIIPGFVCKVLRDSEKHGVQ